MDVVVVVVVVVVVADQTTDQRTADAGTERVAYTQLRQTFLRASALRRNCRFFHREYLDMTTNEVFRKRYLMLLPLIETLICIMQYLLFGGYLSY